MSDMTGPIPLEVAANEASAAIDDNIPTVHNLKCWPQFFDAILRGEKRHDLRRTTDRTFRPGDLLRLQEFDPASQRYTGRSQTVEATYVTSVDQPCALSDQALHPDYCILSIAPYPRH
jgi:hypothetical protein